MDDTLRETLYSAQQILYPMGIFLVAVAALVVAVICTRRKRSPLAAWLLCVGYACLFVLTLLLTIFYMNVGFFMNTFHLGPNAFFWIQTVRNIFEILLMILIGISFIMFRVPQNGSTMRREA